MGALITRAVVGAAHDGAAELIVTLRHDNGGCSRIALDEAAAAALFRSCGVTGTDQLAGQGWEHVRDALALSFDRYTHTGAAGGRSNGGNESHV